MKKLFVLLLISISFSAFSQNLGIAKIDSLQQVIGKLYAEISFLEDEIQSEILKNGYYIIAKEKYSFSKIELRSDEYGKVLDTIANGDSIKIIDKTICCFKVLYKGKVGYIRENYIDISKYPVLNFLKDTYSRKSKSSNYSNSTSSGGSVNVKGYYRKDGTYVRPHTRRR